jgi:hypothetical protein
MTVKSMRPQKLPLLGSNQDSPDPESGASLRVAGTATGASVTRRPIPDTGHTKPHTVSHPRVTLSTGRGA